MPLPSVCHQDPQAAGKPGSKIVKAGQWSSVTGHAQVTHTTGAMQQQAEYLACGTRRLLKMAMARHAEGAHEAIAVDPQVMALYRRRCLARKP